jgi:hypothetical protein
MEASQNKKKTISAHRQRKINNFRQWVSFPLITEMKHMNYSETSILLLKGLPKINIKSRKLQNQGNENDITKKM